MKEYLGFTEGIIKGISRDHSKKETHKVFDWAKAAELIKEKCKMSGTFNPESFVEAGLSEDWGYTSGAIFSEGKIVDKEDTYTYLYSSWATPVLDIDGEEIECWIYAKDSPGWSAETYWPEEAVEILLSK